MAYIRSISEVRGVVRAETDEGASIAVRRAHFDRMPLREGDEADLAEYEKAVAALQENDCYEAALTLLDRSEKSARQVTDRLVRAGYVPKAARRAVARLVKNGLIDDARYAKRIAENAQASAAGVYALRRKLMGKGMDEETVEEALRGFDGEQQRAAAAKAAESCARRYEKLPPREAERKLAQALVRRGFSWEAAQCAARERFGEDE